MVIKQHEALEMETLVRVFYDDGPFSEPFNRAIFVNLDVAETAHLDINGVVPLAPLAKIEFDLQYLGVNTSEIQIILGRSSGVIVYYSKYAGFKWNG